MNKLNCNVIRDILPLYVDEVVCAETRGIIERHLEACDSCRKELTGMRETVVIPVNFQGTDAMRKFKRRWSWSVFWKGAVVSMIVMTLLLGYFCIFKHGIPLKYEDAVIKTGFSCAPKFDPVTNEPISPFPTDTQVWEIEIGSDRFLSSNFITVKDAELVYDGYYINGEEIPTGYVFFVRENPFIKNGFRNDTALSYGYSWHYWAGDTPVPEDFDFTVTVVFADKVAVYSMREEGLFDAPQPHSKEHCRWCTE